MRKNRNRGILLIVLGSLGIVLSVFWDVTGLGSPGLGALELSGLIVGGIMAGAGLVKVLFPRNLLLLRVLTGVYLAGVLYVGLKPYPGNQSHTASFMGTSNFCWTDVSINVLGFVPLGYLLMLSLWDSEKDQRGKLLARSILVAGFGCLVSLFLEVSQYVLIPGRESSLIDWISNTLGTILGIVAYFV